MPCDPSGQQLDMIMYHIDCVFQQVTVETVAGVKAIVTKPAMSWSACVTDLVSKTQTVAFH